MSDNNLRLQVILNAVDKLTRPFRSAQASSKELATAVQQSRARLKELDTQAGSLENFRKLQAENQKLGDRLNYARQRASLLTNELGAMGPPSQRQIVALGRQQLATQRLEERQKKLQQQTAVVRAELYRAGISANDGAGATARITRETMRYNQQLSEQETRLKRIGEQQRRMHAVRATYSRSLEVRDRIAGAGASTTAAGVGMGAPVMAAVKSYASMEDAMKGVAKQVNGLRDDNDNRTARFYEMQDAIKAASEQLPMENGAVDYAALVEGGARMNVANPNDSWADQKRDLLAFASTAAKASTAFELPADELSEGLGKIASLYKVPTRNIEQLGDALNYLDDNAMSKGADIIDVLQRMGGVADRLDYRKAAALGSTFLSLGAAPEIAASASNAMVRELSIATMQSKRFFEGMDLLKLNPAEIEKQMTTDAIGTIQRVLEKVNRLPQDKRLSAMTMLFGKEFGDDAAKLANNLPELQRQLRLTSGGDANGSMQKESDINKDSLSAQWLLVKTGAQTAFSSLGETLREPLLSIMNTVKDVTGTFRRWVEENPRLAGGLLKVGAAFAALAVVLGTVMLAVAALLGPLALMRLQFSILGIKGGGAFGLIGSAINGAGKSVVWLGRLMMANPILAAISLIAMGAIYIWQNWETLGPKFRALWEAVSNGVSAAWAIVRQTISQKWTEIISDIAALPEKFKAMGSAIIDSVLDGINEKWEALKSKLASVTDYLPDWMTGNTTTTPQVQIVGAATQRPIPPGGSFAVWHRGRERPGNRQRSGECDQQTAHCRAGVRGGRRDGRNSRACRGRAAASVQPAGQGVSAAAGEG